MLEKSVSNQAALPQLLKKDASGRLTIRSSVLQQLVSESSNLSRLVGATQSIMAELDLDALLGVIMNTVTEVMHADRSTLFLIDREKEELWSTVAQGLEDVRRVGRRPRTVHRGVLSFEPVPEEAS